MLVVSDGDIIKNLIIPNNNKTLPIGFNQWSGYTFANENFLINSIEYMLDDANLFAARGKEVKLRRLNNKKASEERGFWQMLNILVPLFLLALFGIGFYASKKKKIQHAINYRYEYKVISSYTFTHSVRRCCLLLYKS